MRRRKKTRQGGCRLTGRKNSDEAVPGGKVHGRVPWGKATAFKERWQRGRMQPAYTRYQALTLRSKPPDAGPNPARSDAGLDSHSTPCWTC